MRIELLNRGLTTLLSVNRYKESLSLLFNRLFIYSKKNCLFSFVSTTELSKDGELLQSYKRSLTEHYPLAELSFFSIVRFQYAPQFFH